MNVSVIFLLVALTFYVPYVVRKEKWPVPGEIIIDKSPRKILFYSGFICLLFACVFYQYWSGIKSEDIDASSYSTGLSALVVAYFSAIVASIEIKDSKFRLIEYAFSAIVICLSFAFAFGVISLNQFGYIAVATAGFAMLKFLSKINI